MSTKEIAAIKITMLDKRPAAEEKEFPIATSV